MEDPQVFDELRLDLMMTYQDPLIHLANPGTRAMCFLLPPPFFFLMFRDLIPPELSMDELRCRFFGDEEGEVVAATGGGDGLEGGVSNGSGGGWVPSSDGVLMMLGLGEA